MIFVKLLLVSKDAFDQKVTVKAFTLLKRFYLKINAVLSSFLFRKALNQNITMRIT